MNFAYIRVSTDKQDLNNQKEQINDYCKKNNIILDEIIEVEMSSRKSQEARKLNELTAKLKKGDVLIMVELSRLGRSLIEIINLVKNLRDRGIKLIFTRQPELCTNENNAINDLILTIYGFVAETERDLIAIRTKEALAVKKANGVQLGRSKGTFKGSILDNRKDEIIQMLNNKMSLQKISDHVGTSKQNIDSYIKRHNLR